MSATTESRAQKRLSYSDEQNKRTYPHNSFERLLFIQINTVHEKRRVRKQVKSVSSKIYRTGGSGLRPAVLSVHGSDVRPPHM